MVYGNSYVHSAAGLVEIKKKRGIPFCWKVPCKEQTFTALGEQRAIKSGVPSLNRILCGIPGVWCLA